MKRFRLSGAIAGPIVMAIATFVSIRTVVYLLFPTPIIYQTPNPFALAQGLLMSPSPVFTFIMGPLPEIYYSQAMSMVDLGFNSAALVLNMIGLGVLVWRWTEFIPSDSQTLETTRPGLTGGTPPIK